MGVPGAILLHGAHCALCSVVALAGLHGVLLVHVRHAIWESTSGL